MARTARTSIFARRVQAIEGSDVDRSIALLGGRGDELVSFATGCPALAALPLRSLRAAYEAMFEQTDASAFAYGSSEGDGALRAALLDSLAAWAEPASPDQLVITSGAMQGLDIVFKLLVDDGDRVVVESPTYPNALSLIASYGGDVFEVPLDRDGMDPNRVESAIGDSTPPKLIYVVPTFQNPSGVTLSLERRRRILELADKWDAMIVEDDPYRQLRFTGDELPSLWRLDDGRGRVVHVNTFSKILAPGLRVGWVLADPVLASKMIDAKQLMDTCTNVPGQRLAANLINRAGLAAHLATLRSLYGRKLAIAEEALRANFGQDDCEWSRPQGGFFIWLTLPGVDAAGLMVEAQARGVGVIPGSAFTRQEQFNDCLRICFAYPEDRAITVGFERLRDAYETCLGRTKRRNGR